MKVFQSKEKKLSGSNYSEIYPLAFGVYKKIKQKTKRRTFVRSAYFNKEKVFLDLFWPHLHEKNHADKVRRLKYYQAALDLIQHCKSAPESFQNPMKADEIFHRFAGLTKEGDLFFVQIKENKRNDQKIFISVFPDI